MGSQLDKIEDFWKDPTCAVRWKMSEGELLPGKSEHSESDISVAALGL